MLLAHGLYFSSKEADDTDEKDKHSRVSNVKLSSLDFCIQLFDSQFKWGDILEDSEQERSNHQRKIK